MSRRALLLAAALAAGCAPSAVLMTPPPTAAPPPGAAVETTGEIVFTSGGISTRVAYGPWTLEGGGLALRYAGDGAWAGTRDGSPVRFEGRQGLVTGPSTRLSLVSEKGTLAIQGQWAGKDVDVRVSRSGLSATAARSGCSLALQGSGGGTMSGSLGCPARPGEGPTSSQGTLFLGGEAALVPEVLLPQFVVALLATLPF